MTVCSMTLLLCSMVVDKVSVDTKTSGFIKLDLMSFLCDTNHNIAIFAQISPCQ